MIEEYWTNPNILSNEWEELVAFVRENFSLSNLTLSLDAGLSIPIYEEQLMIDIDEGDYRLNVYKTIIKSLRGLGEIGLKRFYVYWGCYHMRPRPKRKSWAKNMRRRARSQYLGANHQTPIGIFIKLKDEPTI
jgi:hypothetical protein